MTFEQEISISISNTERAIKLDGEEHEKLEQILENQLLLLKLLEKFIQ